MGEGQAREQIHGLMVKKYVGEFKDDKRHGQGTLTSPDGDKICRRI